MNVEEFMQQDFKEVKPKENYHVSMNNELFNYTGLNSLSIDCMRILISIIAEIRVDDKANIFYKIKAKDIADFYDLNPKNLYYYQEKICDNFFDAKLINEREKYCKLRIIQKALYREGYFYIEFSTDFSKFIYNLKKKFSKPELSNFKKLKTMNSILLWMLICSKLNHSYFDVTSSNKIVLTIEEILYFTGNHKKKTMKQFKHLNQKVIEPSIKEYKNCFKGLKDITVNKIKKGRKVVALEIEFQGKFQLIKND